MRLQPHIARDTLIGQEDVTIKTHNWVVMYGPQRTFGRHEYAAS